MARGANVDIQIVQGATFRKNFRWSAEPTVFKAITAVSPIPPATFTVTNHEIPPDWVCAVVSAPWARTLAAQNDPPLTDEYRPVRIIDANTIVFDGVNSAGWVFKAGGYVRYFSPISLVGFEARMQIRDKIGGVILLSLSTSDGTLIVDDVDKYIRIDLPAEATETQTWERGVYDLEVVGPSGVYEIAYGKVVLLKQITTASGT